MDAPSKYDPRYLAGILFFNEHDFFMAHEVWEELWADTAGKEHVFVQGLIQAAVGLYHFGNGNLRGAVKLYHSSRDYMTPCGSPFWGLDSIAFWQQMERCFAEALAAGESEPRPDLREELIPRIALIPEPSHWPNPDDFVEDEEDE